MDGEKTQKYKFLTGTAIKYIAIFAMLLDHIAHLFLKSGTVPYVAMRSFGRITAPVMCFFLVEGYHHTSSLKKYFARLGIFAVISHFAFAYFFNDSLLSFRRSSVITTLLLSLLAVHVINCDRIGRAFKLPIVLIIAKAAEFCDWSYIAVVFTVCFELARGKRRDQLIAYGIAASLLKVLPFMVTAVRAPAYIFENIVNLGILLPILPLALYNGEKGGGKYSKWVFYLFYPAHLLLLGFIKRRCI